MAEERGHHGGVVAVHPQGPGADAPQAEAAYKELQKDFQGALPPKLDPNAVAKSIEFLARSNPSVAKVSAQSVVDSTIVDKLIAQGFK